MQNVIFICITSCNGIKWWQSNHGTVLLHYNASNFINLSYCGCFNIKWKHDFYLEKVGTKKILYKTIWLSIHCLSNVSSCMIGTIQYEIMIELFNVLDCLMFPKHVKMCIMVAHLRFIITNLIQTKAP